MSGDWLALGAIGAVAAVSLVRRGSARGSRGHGRVIRRWSRDQVKQHWAELRRLGKHAGYAQIPFRWADPWWVEVELPLAAIYGEVMEPSTRSFDRASMYGARPGALPPGLAFYNARSARKGRSVVYLADGNHRFNAARMRGDSTFRVYMPEADWERFCARRGSADQVASQQGTITRAGFPWPEDTVLYHGTYAMNAIDRQGFRTRKDGAVSMTGGGHHHSVSTTLVPQRAAAIALGLDTLARVAQRDLSLVDLVYTLQDELGLYSDGSGTPVMVDALTAFSDWVRNLAGTDKPYTVEAYHTIIGHLSLLDKDWIFASITTPKIGPAYRVPSGAIEIEQGYEKEWKTYLLPPGSPLPLTRKTLEKQAERQIVNPSDRGQWVWKRSQGYAHSRCDAAFRIYKAALDVGGRREVFNPLFMDTNVDALAKVPRSSIGVLHIQSSVPRICTDERGAIRLGYLEREDRIRDDKMRSWQNDCQHALDFPRDDDWTQKARTAPLLGLWDSYLRDPTRWPGWTLEQQGARTPATTMLYVDNEEEIRIYDTSKIEIWSVWSMHDIRRRFDLGDRLTFPWFDAKDMNIAVWRR